MDGRDTNRFSILLGDSRQAVVWPHVEFQSLELTHNQEDITKAGHLPAPPTHTHDSYLLAGPERV